MGEKGEGSGGEGGGKWVRRGREVGRKGEGTGNGVPPCPPPQICLRPCGKSHAADVKQAQYRKNLKVTMLFLEILMP